MSTHDPYLDVPPDQLILRDHLAADRTVLANERTLLAYIRTALALVVGGITLVRFFNTDITAALGWTLIPLGVATMAVGIRSYRHMQRRIALLDQAPPKE